MSFEHNVVKSKEHVVAVVHCDEMPTDEDKMRVNEWMKVRLNIQDLEIIFEENKTEWEGIELLEDSVLLGNFNDTTIL
jgi:predicted TIM-barrel enzyme